MWTVWRRYEKVYYLQMKLSGASKKEACFGGFYCDWGGARRSFPCGQQLAWFEFSAWKEHMSVLISFSRCGTQRERERWYFKAISNQTSKNGVKTKKKKGTSQLYLTPQWSQEEKMVPEYSLPRDRKRKKKVLGKGASGFEPYIHFALGSLHLSMRNLEGIIISLQWVLDQRSLFGKPKYFIQLETLYFFSFLSFLMKMARKHRMTFWMVL